MQERLGEASAMAVAFGKSADGLARDGFEEAGLDGFLNRFFAGSSAEAAHGGTESQEALNGHVIVEWGGLGEVANLAFGFLRIFDHRDTTDFDFALCDGEKSGDHAHRGGFPGTVRSQET